MLDQIPTEVTNHSKARTVGVRRRPFVPDALTGIPVLSRGSSDMLGRCTAYGISSGEAPKNPSLV